MFRTTLRLEALHNRPGYWVLIDDLIWNDGARCIIVPSGFLTDLASVPVPFRNILNINGLSRSPAVMHDFLYRTHRVPRAQADILFRDSMKSEGMGFMRYVYWAGVRLGGWIPWRKYT
jgi:hypothetical protein